MIFTKNNCYNGGNKHKFRPRYSEEDKLNIPNYYYINKEKFKCLQYAGLDELKRFFTNKKYEYDVCVWCGKIVKMNE